MNELTITGNLTDEPTLHDTPGGAAILTLTVAVNDHRFDRGRGQWVDRPAVFHRVVAFAGWPENAADLARGTAVTVTGKLADDSWTPEDSGRKVYRTVLEAEGHRREPALRHRRGRARSAANSTPRARPRPSIMSRPTATGAGQPPVTGTDHRTTPTALPRLRFPGSAIDPAGAAGGVQLTRPVAAPCPLLAPRWP